MPSVDSLISKFQAEDTKKQTLATSAVQAYDTNPDQEAYNMKLANQAGIPAAIMPEASDDAKMRVLINRMQQTAEDSPATASFLSDPANAKIAHDSVSELSYIEEFMKKPMESVGATIGQAIGLATMPIANALDYISGDTSETDSLKKMIAEYHQYSKDAAADKRLGTAGHIGRAVAEIAPYLVMGPFGVAAMIGGATMDKLQSNADAGVDDGTNWISSWATGLGAYAMTKLPFGAKTKLGSIGRGVALNTGFGVASRTTDAAILSRGGYDDLASKINPLDPNSMIHDAVMGSLFGGHAAYDIYSKEKADRVEAQQARDFVTQLGTEVTNNKVTKRFEPAMQEFLRMAKQDGPVQDVYMPVQEWNTLWQDGKEAPDEAARRVLGTDDGYHESLVLGDDMKIPLETFLTEFGKRKDFADLAGKIKVRPDGISADEAMSRGELDSGRMAELDRLIKEQDDKSVADVTHETAPSLKVYNDIYGQISGLGRFDRKTAEDNAKIATAHVLRMADDFKQDPWQFWQNDDLSGRISFTNRVERVSARQKINMATDPMLDTLRAEDISGNKTFKDGDLYTSPSLLSFVRDRGVSDDRGDLKSMEVDSNRLPGQKNVLRNDGMELDKVREAAVEQGYLPEGSTTNDLIQAIDKELRGQPVYPAGSEHTANQEKQARFNQMRQLLDAHGVDLKTMSNEDVRKVLEGDQSKELFQGDAKKYGTEEFSSFGPVWRDLVHDEKGAVERLSHFKTGEVIAALHHPDVGDVDLVWGQEGTSKSNGYGLAKILKYHPEVADDLQNILSGMKVKERSENRVNLESENHKAGIRLEWDGKEKQWLLTAFEKGSGDKTRTDTLDVTGKDDTASLSTDSLNKSIFDHPIEDVKTLFQSAWHGGPHAFDKFSMDKVGTGEGEGAHNYVIFNDNDVEIKQMWQNNNNNVKRGFFRTSPDSPLREIGILKDANATTFVHEVGHWVLDDLQRLSSHPDAPEQVKADWTTVRKWLKSEDGTLSTEQHEKFANGMITFFREGKAPSEGLRGAFERLSTWINGIFQKLSDSGVKINDDIREVMGRMFATDTEIVRAREQVDQRPLFATAADMGMGEKEFAAYKRVGEQAGEAAREKLRAASLKEFRRQHLDWWKEEQAKINGQVTKEAQAEPVYQAIQELQKGRDFAGNEVAPMKIDRSLLVDRYGEDFVKRLPKGVTGKDGVHPDIVAERFGFDSADTMIKRMIEAPSYKSYVAQETAARMNDQHGAMHLDGSIVDEATVAVHNEQWSKVLEAEIKALRAKANQVKPFVNAADRAAAEQRRESATKIPTYAEFRETAWRHIGEQDAKGISPYKYLVAERQSARDAFKLNGEGKYDLAADARTRQLLNHFMFLEASRAKAEVKKIGDYIGIVSKRKLGDIGKADQEMLGQVQGILERFGVVPPDNNAIRQSFRDWLEGFEERAGTSLPIDVGFIENPGKQLDQLKMNELRSVRDTLKMIETAARDMNKVRVNGEMVDRQIMASKMARSVYTAIKERKGADTKAGRSLFEKVSEYPLDLVLKRREFIFRRLDNYKDIGPWHDALMNSYNDASEHQLRLIEKVYPDIMDVIRGGGFDGILDRFHRPITHSIDSINASLAKNDIIAIALNCGNESNMTKLMRSGLKLEGRDMPVELNHEQLQEILSHLTAKDIASVNTIWKSIERLKPDAAALARQRLGVEPKWIESQPMEVANGILEGGYFPIKYDSRWSQAGKHQEDAATINDLFTYKGSNTNQGYMKARDERAAYPLDLNWSGIVTRHLNDVILDISHWQFARDGRRLLGDAQVNQALQDRLGKEYSNNLRGWIDQTISAERFSPDVEGFVGNLNQLYRRNMSTFALGFRMFNAIAEVGTQAVTVYKECSASAVRDAVLSYGRNPLAAVRFAESTSPFLKNLSSEIDRDFSSALRDMAGKHSVLDDVKKWGLMAKMLFYRQSAALGWLSGFQEGQKRGYTDDQARRFADSVVRMTQVSGRSGDLSAIEGQSNQWVKSLTQFIGPSLVAYNHLSESATMVKDKGVTKDTIKNALADAVFIGLSQTVLFNIIRGKYPDNLDDIPKWLMARLMFGRMDGIPVMRDMAGMAESYITGEHYSAKPMPIYSGLESIVDVGKAVVKGDFDEIKLGKKVATAVGMATGLPTLQASVTGEFFHDILDGSYEPKHPWSPVTDAFNYHKRKR